jgi:hypothetical protein
MFMRDKDFWHGVGRNIFLPTPCQKSFSGMKSFTLLQEIVHAITGKFKGEQCHVIA